MAWWRRLILVGIGLVLLSFAGLIFWEEYQYGLFLRKRSLFAAIMGIFGSISVAMGALPNLTRDW